MNDYSNNRNQSVDQLKKELEELTLAYKLLKSKSEKESAEHSQAIIALQESEKGNWKNAEKLQSENENSYRELFNNVADAIYIQDEEGTFADVNAGAVKMYGYPRDI